MFDPPLPWFSKNWKVFCTRSTTQMPDQKCCKPRWGGDVGTRPHPHSSITAPFSGQKEACSTRSTSSYLLMYGLSGWCFSGWISRDLPLGFFGRRMELVWYPGRLTLRVYFQWLVLLKDFELVLLQEPAGGSGCALRDSGSASRCNLPFLPARSLSSRLRIEAISRSQLSSSPSSASLYPSVI